MAGGSLGYRHTSRDSDPDGDDTALTLDLNLGFGGARPLDEGTLSYSFGVAGIGLTEDPAYGLRGGVQATVPLGSRSSMRYGLEGFVQDMQSKPDPGIRFTFGLDF